MDDRIVSLVKESCGIRSISRILGIASNTVLERIKRIALNIEKPLVVKGRTYEMDELFTYVGRKDRKICILYSIDRKTREVVDFMVGWRNKENLKMVVETLILYSELL